MNNPKNEKLLDLSGRELATFIPLVVLAFWIGLYPKPFFQILVDAGEQPGGDGAAGLSGTDQAGCCGSAASKTRIPTRRLPLPEAVESAAKTRSRRRRRRSADREPAQSTAGRQRCVRTEVRAERFKQSGLSQRHVNRQPMTGLEVRMKLVTTSLDTISSSEHRLPAGAAHAAADAVRARHPA